MAAGLAIDLKANVSKALMASLAETAGSLGKSFDLYIKK